jgi:hypothetical protein
MTYDGIKFTVATMALKLYIFTVTFGETKTIFEVNLKLFEMNCIAGNFFIIYKNSSKFTSFPLASKVKNWLFCFNKFPREFGIYFDFSWINFNYLVTL